MYHSLPLVQLKIKFQTVCSLHTFSSTLHGDRMMSIDLEQIRSANPIEQIVGEKFTLKRQGSALCWRRA